MFSTFVFEHRHSTDADRVGRFLSERYVSGEGAKTHLVTHTRTNLELIRRTAYAVLTCFDLIAQERCELAEEILGCDSMDDLDAIMKRWNVSLDKSDSLVLLDY